MPDTTGDHLGEIDEKFSLRDNYRIDLTNDDGEIIDRRFGVAAAVLIDVIEGN